MSRHELDPERARSLLHSAAGAYEASPDSFDRVRAGHRRRTRIRRASAAGIGAVTFSALGLAAAQLLPGSGPSTHVVVPVGQQSAAPSPSTTTAPVTTAATTAPAEMTPPCGTSELRVSVSPASAAAGTLYYQIEFLNTAARSCTLRGYPGVSFTDAGGNQLGYPASEEPIAGAQTTTVLVLAGHAVTATLGIPDAYNFPPAACNPVAATSMRVYPPNQTASVLVPFTTTLCTSTQGTAMVAPVQSSQGS